jgi:hypothetical protein
MIFAPYSLSGFSFCHFYLANSNTRQEIADSIAFLDFSHLHVKMADLTAKALCKVFGIRI